MLEFFRSNIKDSYLFKGFLVLLALSFGIWGVGDSIGTSSLSPGIILKAGDAEVRTDLAQRRFTVEMDRFREIMGGRTIDDAVMKRSVMATMIQDLSRAAVIEAAARDVGIVVSRDKLRDAIIQSEQFHTDGQFSQMRFQETLSNVGLTESMYLDMQTAQISSDILLNPLLVSARTPQYLASSLFAYRSETRAADTLLIPSSAMALQKTPTDEELKAVYDKNIDAFTSPEYRKLTVLMLAGDDLVKPDAIDDAEIKTFYEQNSARYMAPESRHLVQLVFDSKEKAEAARALAQPGDTLETLAGKANAGDVVDLGELSATSPLGKTIAPAFQAQAGEITQPIQTPLGWHLVEVKTVKPETVQTFDDVKEEIRKTIAADKGADAVYDASTQMEDSLASGTPPAEVAKTVGARVLVIEAIDNEGKGRDGQPVTEIIDPENFVQTAFSTAAAKDSRLMDLPARDGYYVIHVDEITPPTPKPILEVRSQLAAIWENEERTKQAQALADQLVKDITSSTSLSAIEAKEKRASYASLGPITRFGTGLEVQHVVDATRVSQQMLDKMFTAKVGDVFVAPVATGIVVARVKEINTPDVNGPLAAAKEQLAANVRNEIANDLAMQLTRALQERYPVQLDQAIIDNMIATR